MGILESAKQRLNGVYVALKESLKGVHLGKTQADDIDVAATYYDGNVRNISPRKIAELLKSADEGDISAMHALFYEIEEQDPHIFSEMQKRKSAVLTLDWTVKPPRDATPKEKQLTEWVHTALNDFTQLEDVMFDALDGIGHGFSALAIEWQQVNNEYLPKEITWQPQSGFQLDKKTGELKLLRQGKSEGEELWPNHWIIHKHRTKSSTLARAGLFRVLVWTFVLKHYSVQDLAEFLEIYGLPVRVGKYPEGTSKEARRTLLNAVASLGHNAAGIMPDNMSIDLHNAAQGSHDPYMAMISYCEKAQSKVIVGQVLTAQADNTGSQALGNVHNEVRRDLMVSDAKQLAQTLTAQLIYPLLHLNFADVDPSRLPYFEFDTKEAEDLASIVTVISQAVDYADITEDDFYDRTGFRKPQKDDKLLKRKTGGFFGLSQQHPNSQKCGCQTVSLSQTIEQTDDTAVKKALTVEHELATAVDQLPDHYLMSYEDIVLDVIKTLKATNSYEEAQAKLYELMPGLNADKFAQAMSQALLVSDMAGIISNEK